MSNDVPVFPRETPGLREQTLQEMRRKRHAYAHEVVALVDEVLDLRRRLNSPELKALGDTRADHLRHAYRLIDRTMTWNKTPQGQDYWAEVSKNLFELAQKLDEDPEAFQ